MSEVIKSSALFKWAIPAAPTGVSVIYYQTSLTKTKNEPPESPLIERVSNISPSKRISALMSGTNYEVRVRAVAGYANNEKHVVNEWSAISAFKTCESLSFQLL